MRELASLDAGLVATRFGVPSPSTCSAWGESELRVRDDLFGAWGPSCIVERSALERALAEVALASGAGFLRGERLQRVSRTSNALRLAFDSGRVLEADFVVDATGRNASVARQLGARQLRCDSLVALQGRLARTAVQRCPNYHEVLVESTSQGWWYSVRAPDGSLVAIYFTDSELLRSTGAEALWRAALAESEHTRRRARDYGECRAIEVRSARSQRLDHAAGDRWLAVGDSAMAWDPLSASGLSNAILEARHAAAAVSAALAGDRERYVERVRRAFASYLVTRARIYGSAAQHAGSAFWQSRRLPAALSAPIRLHPSTFLERGPAPDVPLMLAPGLSSSTLLRAVGSGASAHAIVSGLRATTGDAYLGEELIGALQNLVSTGSVTAFTHST